jgi:hypothetical protein
MGRRVDILLDPATVRKLGRLMIQRKIGMISALTFAPDGSGTFAAGSYSGNISIYSEDSGEDRLAEIVMGEPSSGITQVGCERSHHKVNPERV